MAKKKSKPKLKDEIIDLCRDPTKRKHCYLVWSLQNSGLTQLRAIASSSKNALDYVRICSHSETGVIKAWVEKRDMDHLYGHNDITEHQIINRQELYRLAEQLKSVTDSFPITIR